MSLLFLAAEAAAVVGGACVGNLRAHISSVVTDSREVSLGALFVALRGERVDGHDYIGAALAAGASCIFADSAQAAKARACFAAHSAAAAACTSVRAADADADAAAACLVLVDSPLRALQDLAREHRRRMKNLYRIGVTGSSGKTTTKECIAAVLREAVGPSLVAVNPGNLNSDLGLPLALFGVRPEHRYGVFEMGMNRVGEMDELSAVYEPDLVVITNIGTAHIGIIGSQAGIAAEKKAAFSRFNGSQKALIWEADSFKDFLKADLRGKSFDFGPHSTVGLESIVDAGLDGWHIGWKGEHARFPLTGKHNLLNACAALSLADLLHLDPARVCAGLEKLKPLFGRSEILHGKITMLRDCYNANPDSMAQTIACCDSSAGGSRRIYVLGAMFELGEASLQAHEVLGRQAAASAADIVFFFGNDARASLDAAMAAACRAVASDVASAVASDVASDVASLSGACAPAARFQYCSTFEALRDGLLATLRPGDFLLIKGSRGLALERLADAVQKAGWVAPNIAPNIAPDIVSADAASANIASVAAGIAPQRIAQGGRDHAS